jgi:DNA-3-methyladenine glycosylase II
MAAVRSAAAEPPGSPHYWDDACKHLARRDRVLKKLIPLFGEARLASRGDAFTTLARSIIGQQISVKAAQSVWERFALAVSGAPGTDKRRVAPKAVLALDTPALRAAGLSARKCEYLQDLAQHFADGRSKPAKWGEMDDVLPLDDLGLLKGISLNYFSGEPVSRAEARDVAEAWAPYRSVATWYIWRSLDPLPVEY